MAGVEQKRAYVRVIQAYEYIDEKTQKHYKHAIGDEFELVAVYSNSWLIISVDNGQNHSYIPRNRVVLLSKPTGIVSPTSLSTNVSSRTDSTETSAGISAPNYSESGWKQPRKETIFLRLKQPIPPSSSSFTESVYEVANSTPCDDDNLYDHLEMEEEQEKINMKETGGPYKGHTVALIQKIRDQDEELKEKNAQLRRLEESRNAELRDKDEQLRKMDASRKRWQIKAGQQPTEQGSDGDSPYYAKSDNGVYLNAGGAPNSLPGRPKENYFEFPEKPALMRSAKFASKKMVHLGVFLEYRKVNRTNAIIIHVVLCSDEKLMKSTNNTKLYASKPLLVYEDRDDPVIHVRSLQWAKTNNENQEDVNVVSLDNLWAGLPWEIKFIREFRSRLLVTEVPDILKFDVCVVQPRIPETTLNVWCDMKEITSSVESKSHKNEDVRNSVTPNRPLDGQKSKRVTLFGVREVGDVPPPSEISTSQVEMRNHAPSEAAGHRREAVAMLDPIQEDSRFAGLEHNVPPARSPTTPPPTRPTTTCPRAPSPIISPRASSSNIFPHGRKDQHYENIIRLPQKKH